MDAVLRHVRKLAEVQALDTLPDGDLLDRFVQHRDESAFTVLVRRYAPLVLGICRRILRQAQDAEDACQAVFLVLACKAGSISKKEALPSFLHGVAFRVATTLRRNLTRRLARQVPLPETVPAPAAGDVTWGEVEAILDEELHRLPERFRAPLVLCYLEGLTRDEAAQQLGWSLGTLRGRLERGREQLRLRLSRRGLGLPAVLLASALGQVPAAGAAEASLVAATIEAVSLFAKGQGASTAAVPVLSLAEGVLQAMLLSRIKIGFGVVALLGLLVLSLTLAGSVGGQPEKDSPKKVRPQEQGEKPDVGRKAMPARKELARLQGSWKVVQLTFQGEDYAPEAGGVLQLTIAGDKVEVRMEDCLREGTVSFVEPNGLDVKFRSFTWKMIFRFDGEWLILARGNKRPTAFRAGTDEASKDVSLWKLKATTDNTAAQTKARLRCGGQLLDIGQALHDYHSAHGKFPGPSLTDRDGKPLLSWRVAVLPYLGEKELYEQFHLDEPWDSEHNRKLLPRMPKVYASVGKQPKTPHGTFFQALVGKDCFFEVGRENAIADLEAGTTQVLMLIVAAEAVPWTRPADIDYSPDKPLPSFVGGPLEDGLVNFALADGSVRIMNNAFDEEKEKAFRAALLRKGMDQRDLEKLK